MFTFYPEPENNWVAAITWWLQQQEQLLQSAQTESGFGFAGGDTGGGGGSGGSAAEPPPPAEPAPPDPRADELPELQQPGQQDSPPRGTNWKDLTRQLEGSLMALPPAKGVALIGSIARASIAARATAAATRGTSVLGHYPAYLEKAAELGARRFSVPSEIWGRMSPAERLAANGKFLDRLIARGDEALLTTPVGRATAGSSLEWEINYLLGRGYQVVDDGWRLIPGP